MWTIEIAPHSLSHSSVGGSGKREMLKRLIKLSVVRLLLENLYQASCSFQLAPKLMDVRFPKPAASRHSIGLKWFSNRFSPSISVFLFFQLSQDIGYVLYSALGSFYIPSCIMVFVYIRIYFAAKARARRGIKKKPHKQHGDQVNACLWINHRPGSHHALLVILTEQRPDNDLWNVCPSI